MNSQTQKLRRFAGREKPVLLRCMAATFAAGFACHAVMFFSDISFYDDVTSTYDVGGTHIFGRFTLALLGKITRVPFGGSNYSLPWFNGLVSLLFLSIFAWMTVRLLHIACRWMQVLVCALFVSFPVVTSLFAYGFAAPYYMFALPLCGISAYCLTLRGNAATAPGRDGLRRRMLLLAGGALLMALMVGIYQAYLPVLLTLEVLILLKDEVENEGVRQNRRWRYALGGTILGFAGYLVLMELSLKLTGKELYAYRGLDSLGSGGSSYPERILWAYRIFFEPESFEQLRGSTDYLMFMWSMGIVYRVILAVTAVLAVWGAWRIWTSAKIRAQEPKQAPEACRSGVAVRPRDSDSAKMPDEGGPEAAKSGTEHPGPGKRSAGRFGLAGLVRYLILTALYPLTVNFIFVMTDYDVYSLMLYAQVFVFVYPVMMTGLLSACPAGTGACAPAGRPGGKSAGVLTTAEPAARESACGIPSPAVGETDHAVAVHRRGAGRPGRRFGTALRVLTAALAVYSVIFYCRYDNLCYYKAERMQDAAIAYDEILIARIMAVDGYDASLPVCFVNDLEKDVTGWTVDEELEGANITPYTGLEIINCYSWVSFMSSHCGYSPRVIENYHQYDEYIEEEDMPSYPAEGSIRVIDGVIVVNF